MKAMQLDHPGGRFRLVDLPRPAPGPGEVLVRVQACGVCRTDLHVVDGDITDGRYPIVPGHQVVGTVADANGVEALPVGTRVGIPWLGHTCGHCRFCLQGAENLCDAAEFTGYQRNGGYAEYVVADARFCFHLPSGYDDLQVAPLLCAGLIGYRALRMAGEAPALGFYGFGNAAHILTQIARWQGRRVYAFTRDGDVDGQAFARELGAAWAGGTSESAPELLDAAILFAPAGTLVPLALTHVRKGGQVICAGIHMSDIPSFPYVDLWGERVIRSVANLTRADGVELLALAPRAGVRTAVEVFSLAETPQALDALRAGRIRGAAVVRID
ncbi:MAG: zinc-dependent alcohol dehydrogenase family protein [Pseudomonadales bacterium]|nr:zinc-dependent alcohol dehydrogenase family protein [Pseudomonadales bacterium]MCP5183797.1 zinc-dependent alcohol dehydrogenase family protein [Pseudomonadales bacterium]